MKKRLCFILAVLFMVISVLTGCSMTKNTVSNGKQGTKPQATVTPAAKQEQSDNSSAKTAPAPAAVVQKSKPGVNTALRTASNTAKKPATAVSVKSAAKVTVDTAVRGASEYIKKASAKAGYKINDWDALALKSNGYNIDSAEFKLNNKGYIDYKAENFVKDNSGYYLTDYARSYIGIASAGYDPSNYMGFNITDIIKNSTSRDGKFFDTVDGGEDLLNCHVWSMIALEAGKVSYDRQTALKYLETHQNKDGGFYIFAGFPQSDIDFTAMAVIALNMAGRDKTSSSVSMALNYLKKQLSLLQKNTNGETAETLSVILQAVVASKDDVNNYKINGRNLVDELLTFYNTDGSFKHLKSGSGDAIATRQALTALTSYKSKTNVYSCLTFKKGNFYNTTLLPLASMKMHKAIYNSASGEIEISAITTDADKVTALISDGTKEYTEIVIPVDNLVNINKELPASNYSVVLKSMKNGNLTSILKETVENVNKQTSATVRVESYDRTLVKTIKLTAGNTRVYDYNGNSFTTAVLSTYTFVMKALIESNILPAASYDFGSPYIAGIDNIFGGKFGGWDGWMYYLNGKDPGVAMSDAKVNDSDEILVYYGDWGIRPLDITAPDNAGINETVSIRVSCDGKPLEGAVVYADGRKFNTDASGAAFISIPAAGVYEIYAEKNDESGKPLFIRSKRVNINIK